MPLKITKADWDACIEDDAYWKGVCMDEVLLDVNDEEVADLPDSLSSEAQIRVIHGVICTEGNMEYVMSLTAFLRAWLKRQERRHVLVAVPAEITNKALEEHLKKVGGKIA